MLQRKKCESFMTLVSNILRLGIQRAPPQPSVSNRCQRTVNTQHVQYIRYLHFTNRLRNNQSKAKIMRRAITSYEYN